MTSLYADQLLTAAAIYLQVKPARAVSALALRDGRVLAAGAPRELENLIGPGTERIDFGERTILPGLTDAHIHLEQYARTMSRIDCDTPDFERCLARIRSRAAQIPPGTWIEGHGWDQNHWDHWPTAAELDRVAPDHPVYLSARSLHAAVANSAALRAAGVGREADDPPAGRFQRDQDGRLTGVLFEDAMRAVSDAIPPPSADALAEMLLQAQEQLWRLGVTGVHDFDGRTCFSALQKLHSQARLGLRSLKHLQARYLDAASEVGLRSGFGDDMLRFGNVKIFADGALGPRTAAMHEAYDDDPDNQGMLLLDQEQILEAALKAARAGWPMTIHAIGDRAIHHALSALETLRELCQQEDLPWHSSHRIEHVQLLRHEDFSRLARLRVVASMQPIHAISDRSMAIAGWGERVQRAYAWRSLVDSGVRLVFGSDAPVDSPNPFWGLHAAVNRSDPKHSDDEPWLPDLAVDLPTALSAYTVGPAQIAGLEGRAGSLEPGSWADLIVLDRDPYQRPTMELGRVTPVAAMVNGSWRFRTS